MQYFVSLVDILHQHAQDFPNQIAVKFLTQKGYEIITYSELDKRAKAVAQFLQQHESHLKERAVLLLPPGLDYIVAFLGCLYAGVVAVPVYPPRKNQHADRVFSIIKDAQAAFVITNQALVDQFASYEVINIDTLSTNFQAQFKQNTINPHDNAFIQYTSGSTTSPKGVLISHQNVMTNIKMIQNIFPGGPEHKVCSWLPPYHDMGLVGGILCSLFIRTELILMSPTYFLQSPIRWLEVISDERVTMTVAPNFAFDLCTKKITPSQLSKLDLSCLQCVYNGSEPIQYALIEQFCSTFAEVGFTPKALYSCYGLAEATLMLTVKRYSDPRNSLNLLKSEFELGNIRIPPQDSTDASLHIVNCGSAKDEHHICIVDPNTHKLLPEGEIGEIWASGPSIANGYWNQPELTHSIFKQQLAEYPNNQYLRTRDLGFIHQGDLFVTGRLNDRMIIGGRNYYPQDIEQAAYQSHPAFEPHGVAAFTIDDNGVEKLVLLQEIKREAVRQIDADSLFSKLRGTLLDFGLVPHCIVLLKPYSLPKTSSGKIRRSASRHAFLVNELQSIARWNPNEKNITVAPMGNLKQWLETWLVQHLQMIITQDDYHKSLVDLGINSIAAVELANDLQKQLGKPLELIPLFEQCTLKQLITLLSEDQSELAVLSEKKLLPDLKSIYHTVNDGISTNVTVIAGQQFINYSGYNYLGLSGDPLVTEAVIEAVKEFGTSVSASRLVSGEKSLHGELERAIAGLIGSENCVVLPSGYSTNITILTHLFGKQDLIIYDELSHNSILQGALFSGAQCFAYPHNEYEAITQHLTLYRDRYKKVLLVTEGIFSMDGDIPDLPKLISIKKQFNIYLMIDEAHSMGVLGKSGRGIREHFSLSPDDVDIWMGTLSKSFASCGGYIAGSHDLIENLKFTASGFVYSAGMSPANTAAALAAIQVMIKEPERLRVLMERSKLLLSLLKESNIPTGLSHNTPIIPLIVGKNELAIELSEYLKQQNILALPIIYPAVPQDQARVRLFVNCLHTVDQIHRTGEVLQQRVGGLLLA